MTKRRIIALVGALTLLVSSGAFPALAEKPETELGPHLYAFSDPDNDVVVFWNVTRDDFCDWESGPPPALVPVAATEIQTGNDGAVILTWHVATAPLEVWKVDDPNNMVDECVDTEGQTGPWATGEAKYTVQINDSNFDQMRRNTLNGYGQGTVFATDDGSRWHFSWSETGELVNFEIVNIQANYNLRKKGK